MTRVPQPNYLKAWREYRRMTQARLAEAVGTTGAVISLLESGERGLSDKWLFKLAPVLGTRPGHLLEVDPADAPNDIQEIWDEIPEEHREQARNVLRAFRRHTPDIRPETRKSPSDKQTSDTKKTGGKEAP